ncbi:unnamed protein product [Brugia timori]|uniref:Uncharacterized protein n=1 Tax=Brugia timori TaxID=42155 RepID=A0A3P7W2J1_9BILA|nr:unnamed protein product [Brugia timori]
MRDASRGGGESEANRVVHLVTADDAGSDVTDIGDGPEADPTDEPPRPPAGGGARPSLKRVNGSVHSPTRVKIGSSVPISHVLTIVDEHSWDELGTCRIALRRCYLKRVVRMQSVHGPCRLADGAELFRKLSSGMLLGMALGASNVLAVRHEAGSWSSDMH